MPGVSTRLPQHCGESLCWCSQAGVWGELVFSLSLAELLMGILQHTPLLTGAPGEVLAPALLVFLMELEIVVTLGLIRVLLTSVCVPFRRQASW